MAAKPKKKPSRASVGSIQKEQQKERKLMSDMMAKERLTKWLLIAVVILLLLLILFAGYATDWLRGLHKDKASNSPVTSSLDSAKTKDNGTTTPAAGGGTGSSGTGSTGGMDEGTNSSTTSNNTTSTGTNTSRDTSSTTTTTNNNNTTTNNPTPSPGLINLYAGTAPGQDINKVINNAQLLGLSKDCHAGVLVQVCDFSDGNATVTTKNLLGNGTVTSVTKNF